MANIKRSLSSYSNVFVKNFFEDCCIKNYMYNALKEFFLPQQIENYSDISLTGDPRFIFVQNDDSPTGDGTPSLFYFDGTTLYNLVAIEQ